MKICTAQYSSLSTNSMKFLSSSLLIILFVSALPLLCLSSSDNLLSLSVENPEHVIKSRNNNFTAGFYGVGENAFVFAVWFTEPQGQNLTVIWMANRDVLVNGKWKYGLERCRSDTLVPGQRLTRHASLVSSKSQTNPSSGFHKLFFDNDNVIRLVYDGPELSSIYWPPPWNLPQQNGSKTSDCALVIQRRLTIDTDSNVRVYSRRNRGEKWYVLWKKSSAGFSIHGICGENSFCKYEPYTGPTCSCLPGYRFKDESNLSLGCKPDFNWSCKATHKILTFYTIPNGDFYGYDQGTYLNITFDECKNQCLTLCNCKGFQYLCYPKTLLVNGYLSPAFKGGFHLRLPNSSSLTFQERNTKCELVKSIKLDRVYVSRQDSVLVKVFLCYSELEEATSGFSEEIGRGAGGTVYKGVLKDGRVAAIKRHHEANQLEKNLESKKSLDWRRRYEIALGTARGLAYLHEECLEWVLHCDIKPQNILLDSDYKPKVADFGLSKLQNRNNLNNPSFSRIRGTRGSLTSREPSEMGERREEKKKKHETTSSWLEQIMDSTVKGSYEMETMEILVTIALQCVEDDRDARPSMSHVVKMLQSHEIEY
ncbi:hypothetical protein K1719_043493 [Acacia pycnantha]|nr:hypothetical protein K1719_043493 [Acacia pycnantha]